MATVNRLMATVQMAANRRPRYRPHASTKVTAVGSSERSTAPGIEARNRSNCRKHPPCVSPARHLANMPSSTETGLMSRPIVLSGPAWLWEVMAMTGPRASTTAMAANMRRASKEVLRSQCHSASTCAGGPAITRPAAWPISAAASMQ